MDANWPDKPCFCPFWKVQYLLDVGISGADIACNNTLRNQMPADEQCQMTKGQMLRTGFCKGLVLVTFIWTETCHSKALWGIWGVPMERNCVHLHRLPAPQLCRTIGWVCRWMSRERHPATTSEQSKLAFTLKTHIADGQILSKIMIFSGTEAENFLNLRGSQKWTLNLTY